MSSYSQLLADIVRLLDKFDPQNNDPDHFVSEAANSYKARGEVEQTFLVEVLSGCLCHRPLLDVVVNGFYIKDGKNFLRVDYNLFVVMCYLATFRLNELGLKHFSKLINSQDVNKMHKFLTFFFDARNLNTWIKDEWCQVYDVVYITEKLIDPLLRWQPDMQIIIDHLANILANKVTHKKESQPVSVPSEFNITKPRPRAIPVPEEIPQLQVQTKVPRSTYDPPREEKLLEKLKRRNRQRAEEHLLEANADQFRCAIPQESSKKKRVLSEIMKEKEAKIKPILYKARHVPQQITENIPIKMNTAAILRENVLYQRKVKEDLQRIDQILEGGQDPATFEEYQKQKNEELMEQQLADIERRRLQEKIFFEELILAREARIEKKRQQAAQQKEEPAGHNLLDEMSLLELRERLGLLKEAQVKEEEEKRRRIINERQAKEQLLLDKLEQISLNREALSKKAVLRHREEELKKLKLSKLTSGDQQLGELRNKLEEKKKEHHQLIETHKKKTQENLQRVQGPRASERRATEERWWQNLEEGRERKAQLLNLQAEVSQKAS
ncbi:cilia- and flagella-associated protein 99 isoform X2 [Mobula birostris]|uniref:cilia- and flagella-associated protein 99 isoform X2 n=1 Tax=Mobula birostris TaxID=1983395 RepID=UPI003B284E73